MSMRHLGTRAGEHLNMDDSHKSATKDYLRYCHQCCNGICNVTSFKILGKCHTDYDTKIHEALLTKKLSPQLNKQVYKKGVSFCLICFVANSTNTCLSKVRTRDGLILLFRFILMKQTPTVSVRFSS